MPEALAVLDDFLAEGTTEAATATEAAEATAAGVPAVSVETPAAIEEKQQKAVTNKGKKAVAAAIPSLSDVPTPKGGVGVLLAVGLLIVFAIVPAPGQSVTRLSLIWKAFIGQASLGSKSGTKQKESGSLPAYVPAIQGIFEEATT